MIFRKYIQFAFQWYTICLYLSKIEALRFFSQKYLQCPILVFPYLQPCLRKFFYWYDILTLFWLGFFMYVKWLGGGKITFPCPKSSKKDTMNLKFTPHLGIHKNFQKKSKKLFLTQYFWWRQQLFGKKWPKMA